VTNTYRALSILAKSEHGDGVVELDLTPYDEHSAVTGGHIEIVPRKYKVLSDNYTAAPQGQTFDGAFPVENEAALIQGGHIERVEPPKETPAEPKPAAKKKED
jgi:hypothetical protein